MKASISVTCNECLDTRSSIWHVNYIPNRWEKENKTVNEYMVHCESISNTFMYKVAGIECKHKNKPRPTKRSHHLIMQI